MLGCFVGPADVAASGVPERFLDKSAIGKTMSKPPPEGQSSSTTSKDATKTAPGSDTAATGQAEPMEVDQ